MITGDLVGSTKAGPDAVAKSFAIIADVVDATSPDPAFGKLTRFRGDGWQALFPSASSALHVALLIRARLRAASPEAIPSRMAVGLGSVTRLGTDDLSDADGTAFQRAGRTLDTMARRRMLACDPDEAPPGLHGIVALCDALCARWSAPQAEAVALSLEHPDLTQAVIADKLGISQQSLQERLDLAGFWAIDEVLNDPVRGWE